MKRDNKKALYESIMTAVAKEVKKALNEDFLPNDDVFPGSSIKNKIIYNFIQNAVNKGLIQLHPTILNAIQYVESHNIPWDEYEINGKSLAEIIEELFNIAEDDQFEDRKLNKAIKIIKKRIAKEFGYDNVDDMPDLDFEISLALPYIDWTMCKPNIHSIDIDSIDAW